MQMSDFDHGVIEEIERYLTGPWTGFSVRWVTDTRSADGPKGPLACLDDERGRFFRSILFPIGLLEDAPHHGGASWAIEFMEGSGVLVQLQEESRHGANPIIVQYP